MSFRRAYAADLPMRAVDLLLHAMAATLLPGPWWLQFAPDTALPVLWAWSMATDRPVPEGHWMLLLHQRLHLRRRWPWWTAFVVVPVLALTGGGHVVLLHFAAHWMVDACTHAKEKG